MSMPQSGLVAVIEHAVDNQVNSSDYSTYKLLEDPTPFTCVTPEPCAILPRQFGFWFHTGPGFADVDTRTYGHKILTAEGVRVLGSDGVVVYRGDWADATSLNYVSAGHPGCQFRRSDAGLSVAATSRRLSGTYFLGYNAGHRNYAHWLNDGASMLYYYVNELAPLGIRILLPRQHSAFVAYYVSLMRIPPEMIEYIGDEVVSVDTLLHSSFFSYDHIPYSVVGMLQDMQREYLPAPGPMTRRIFVSRSETAVRALLNEHRIVEILKAAGFEIIVPGSMAVAEQIAAFQQAETIVGVHGAGLANIVFCQPGARVIELFPEYTVSSQFWMLASHFRLKYGVVFGTSFDQDIALSNQTGSWDAPFVICEAALRASLRI